jgi:tetratricopeptide (TPR) repeat protein
MALRALSVAEKRFPATCWNRGVRTAAGILWAALAWCADPPELAFRKAAAALTAGELSQAEQGFLEVLQSQPRHIGALGNLGIVYSRQERVSDAITVYQRALKLSPNEPGLLLNLGLAYLKLEEYQSAKPLLARADRSPLASAQTKELLATCRLFTGEEAAAAAALETLPRTPGVLYLLGSAYLRLNQPDRARAVFADLLTASASPAQARFLLGKAYAEGAQFDAAAAELRQALVLDSRMTAARVELGKVLLGARDLEGAAREFRVALAGEPANVEATYYLGALLVLMRKEAEALPYLEKVRSARPNGWTSFYYLGRARMQLGHAAEAIPLLEKAAALNPDEAAVYFQLGRAYRAAGRISDAQRAAAAYTRLRDRSAEREESVFANRR